MKKVTIIGGGLAGLITSIQLARASIPVVLFEKKKYPFHRVCGEYISNEAVPFLRSLTLYPEALRPSEISRLQLTSTSGKAAYLPLDLGGFGVSRYAYDHWLATIAQAEGVIIHQEKEITAVQFQHNQFLLRTQFDEYETDIVVGAFGKRSKIDITMERLFIKKRSPYVGVKYHIRYDHPKGLISLHNFQNGYCGISEVEDGVVNLCYLTHGSNLKKAGNIKLMEEKILYQNPFLKHIFQHATFLFDHPETINEISFETKGPVENHVLMSGDAAGMITPLCGNGMAMAIHASKILSDLLLQFCNDQISRATLESSYTNLWSHQFERRLWIGRKLQNLFGSDTMSNLAVSMAKNVKPIGNYLVSKTHGKPF